MNTTHNAYIVENEVFNTRPEAEYFCRANEIEIDTIQHRFATDLGDPQFAVVEAGKDVEDGDPIHVFYLDAVYNSLRIPGARTVVWAGETREEKDGLVAAISRK